MVPDSECLVVACEILDALPIGDFGIKLNHRRLLDAILDICGVPADKF
jgi:histidyl-tRNA synthetase